MSACKLLSLLAIRGPSYKTMVLLYKYNSVSYVIFHTNFIISQDHMWYHLTMSLILHWMLTWSNHCVTLGEIIMKLLSILMQCIIMHLHLSLKILDENQLLIHYYQWYVADSSIFSPCIVIASRFIIISSSVVKRMCDSTPGTSVSTKMCTHASSHLKFYPPFPWGFSLILCTFLAKTMENRVQKYPPLFKKHGDFK